MARSAPSGPSRARGLPGLPWTRWGLGLFLVVGLFGLEPLARLITDGWWFASVGYGDVFWAILTRRAALAAVGGAVALGLVGGAGRRAARHARSPGVAPRGLPGKVSPVALSDLVSALVAGVTALVGWRAWDEWLLFRFGGVVGRADPVFGYDVGFYLFRLPLLLLATQTFLALVGVALVVAAATYLGTGAVRLQLAQHDGQLVTTGVVVPPEVERHLGTLVAVGLAGWSALLVLDRYALLCDADGLFPGPGWAELHATLPLLGVRAAATAVAAVLVAVLVRREAQRAAGAVMVGLGVLAVLGLLVPGLAQRFSVQPNELSRESGPIADHLAATRAAFGLDDVVEVSLPGVAPFAPDDARAHADALAAAPVWDPGALLEVLAARQEWRAGYAFGAVDRDRYWVDGERHATAISARELALDALPEPARTWVNRTLTYTHGYGVTLGPVGGRGGLPDLYLRDVPLRTEHPDDFGLQRPELYFGESLPGVAVVGATAEFDFPRADGDAYTRYQGADGVRVGRVGRAWFALREWSWELLLSSDVRADSRVLMYRNVLDRARRIAPMLRFDSDPYLVVDKGRLVWVLDAYTTSAYYPYAAHVPGFDAYARNPVKVTIDAYDGTTRFWRLPVTDPIAEAWEDAFPGLFQPVDSLGPSLRAHLRYGPELFAAQAALFATYHLRDPSAFYRREGEWEASPTADGPSAPAWTTAHLPGAAAPEFTLLAPYSPRGKPQLAGWMVARNDGDHLGELRVYEYPPEAMVGGPRMVAARIDQDDAVRQRRAQWEQQGAEVELGTLSLVPLDDGLLYVLPLYLRAAEGAVPQLERVVVADQDHVATGATVEEAFLRLVGPPRVAPPATAPGMVVPSVTTAELVRLAAMHWEAAKAAAARGDWATWGTHQQALGELITALAASVGK